MIQVKSLTTLLALALPAMGAGQVQGADALEQVKALGEIQSLRVDVEDLDVAILPSDGPGLVMALRFDSSIGGDIKAPKVFGRDGRIVIHQGPSDRRIPRRSRGTLELRVPGGSPLEVESRQGSIVLEALPSPVPVTLVSTTGDITVGRDAVVEGITMSTPSGQITFKGLAKAIRANTTQGGILISPQGLPISCELNSVSGSIQVLGGCKHLEASTTSGSIMGLGLDGNVEAHSVQGWVSMTLDSLGTGESASIHTMAGPITLGLPPDSEPSGSLETLGTISCGDMPLLPHYGMPHRYRLPGKGGELNVSSTGGAIRLTRGEGDERGRISTGRRPGAPRSDRGSAAAP